MAVDTSRFGLSADSAKERPYLASMGIYVFSRQTLFDLLDKHPGHKDFGKEIIPEALARGDLGRLGELVSASHESSRDLFENSCAELDALVDIARHLDGCLGHAAKTASGRMVKKPRRAPEAEVRPWKNARKC